MTTFRWSLYLEDDLKYWIRIPSKMWSAVIVDDAYTLQNDFTDNQGIRSEFIIVENLCITLVLCIPQNPVTVSVRLRGCCLEVLVDRHISRAYHLLNYSQSSDSRSWKMNDKVRYLEDLYCRLKEKVWRNALTVAMKKWSYTCLVRLGNNTSAVERSWISAVLWSFNWCCKNKYLKEVKIWTIPGEFQV